MTKKRKIILAVAAVLSALLLVAAVVLGLYTGVGNSYGTQLNRGQKYLDAGDYENAVLCYQRAVQAEPEQADGYIGLAQAYIGLNKMALARQVLDNAMNRTNSARIQLMLQNYFSTEGDGAQTEMVPTFQDSGSLTLNTELLGIIAQSTYEDYRRDQRLSNEQTGPDSYQAQATEWGLQLAFHNTDGDNHVIDTNTGKPYSGRRPNSVTLSDLSVLFGGRSSVTFEELCNLKLDNVRMDQDDEDNPVVCFEYDGCQATIACDKDGTITATAYNVFVPIQQSSESDDNLRGKLINAQTGMGVGNATMEFSGPGGQTTTVETSSNGEYSLTLDPGVYTVLVKCPGFVQESFEVVVNQVDTLQDLTISPLLNEGEIRFVLTWNAEPADLDSYIMGETADGQDVFVNFRNKQSMGNDGQVLAELDVDDTNGYGPETTTLYATNGSYEFLVVDFNVTGTMGQKGATVKIYVGNQAPIVVDITPDAVNQWLVCRVENGEVEVVNAAVDRGSNGTIK